MILNYALTMIHSTYSVFVFIMWSPYTQTPKLSFRSRVIERNKSLTTTPQHLTMSVAEVDMGESLQ